MCISNLFKIVLHNITKSFLLFGISVLLCWLALLFKFPFPGDKLIYLLWSLFFCLKYILDQTNFSSSVFAVFFLKLLFVVSQFCFGFLCDKKICIVDVISLLRIPLVKSSESCKVVNFKRFFWDDSHCSSSFLFPMMNRFSS